MQRSNNILPPGFQSQRTKLIDESTQSEEKSTRNVGTMHEPIQTRNFGNEIQPQSSATQTSLSLKPKPSKPPLTYIDRSEHTPTPIKQYYPDQTIHVETHYRPIEDIYYSQFDTRSYDHFQPRSPSPPVQTTTYHYDGQYPSYDTQYKGHSHLHPPLSQDYHHTPIYRHPSPPPTSYRVTARISPDRTPSPQHRSYTPTPSYPPRDQSPHRRPRSRIPRHRPQMYSQETDTSLDAMKQKQHAAVQFEPRSTKEQGTTPSLRTKKPTTYYRPTPIYSPQQQYPTSSSNHQDHSQGNYHIQPTTTNDYYYQEEEEEEEYAPSMHDKTTMAELNISFDHYTQCEAQPYMADRYIQTTPTFDENEQLNMFTYSDESDIRQLPRRDSIYIPQPVVIQPDTLPRIRRSQPSPTRPKCDGLDYTGGILELSLQHGQQQRTTPIRDSPLLNIGTEKIIPQLPTSEYTVPFEVRYVDDPDGTSTLGSRNNGTYIVPVLNSSRTHVFPDSPVRQSKSNGNFYLSTAPTRSLNSSFRVNIRADGY
jgi:hypothetical protein